MTEDEVASGLLMGGLGGGTADQQITVRFGVLGFSEISVTINPNLFAGSKPLAPGEIHNFYQRVYEGKPRKRIDVKVVFRGKTIEKHFLASPRTAAMVVSVANGLKRAVNVVVRVRDFVLRGK